MKNEKKFRRCPWPKEDRLMIKYHDTEWGVPLHQDRKLFEFMVLDTFQAGLSWAIVLKKRVAFKKAFNNFDAAAIAKYRDQDYQRLIKDKNIIRNKLKIRATINNAQKFLTVQKEFGSFDNYIWLFVQNKTIKHRYKNIKQLPTRNLQSDKMSQDLKQRGFKFVGSTICYAFMQAAGLVNDHLVDCFYYQNINQKKK